MPSFRQRVQTEQELVDGNAADVGCEAAADLIHQVWCGVFGVVVL